ncbi:HD domain-containing protein [Desulfoplanes sp.]
MTDRTLARISHETKTLAASTKIDFYDDFNRQYMVSKDLFFSHPVIGQCKRDVVPLLAHTGQHGIDHAKKVAIDAGTLILVERRGWSIAQTKRWVFLAQLAGLLHDICIHLPDHARPGAVKARDILSPYPITDEERETVVFAIRNHESRTTGTASTSPMHHGVSNALYDADIFRWGPDVFDRTLLETRANRQHSLQDIQTRLLQAMNTIRDIGTTFRTRIGQQYGPQFLRLGLQLGKTAHDRLCEHSPGLPPGPCPSRP